MTEPNADETRRIAFTKRAWVALATIQNIAQNEEIQHGDLRHWQQFAFYLERAADVARNLERTSRARRPLEVESDEV